MNRPARAALVSGALLMSLACGDQGGAPAPPETNILTGPRFYTGDPARPFADALVVSQGKIVALADRAEIPRLIAGGGSVRQLAGALAVPGLTDAHGHLLGYAEGQRRVDLVGAKSLEEALARVEAYAREHADATDWCQAGPQRLESTRGRHAG